MATDDLRNPASAGDGEPMNVYAKSYGGDQDLKTGDIVFYRTSPCVVKSASKQSANVINLDTRKEDHCPLEELADLAPHITNDNIVEIIKRNRRNRDIRLHKTMIKL